MLALPAGIQTPQQREAGARATEEDLLGASGDIEATAISAEGAVGSGIIPCDVVDFKAGIIDASDFHAPSEDYQSFRDAGWFPTPQSLVSATQAWLRTLGSGARHDEYIYGGGGVQ